MDVVGEDLLHLGTSAAPFLPVLGFLCWILCLQLAKDEGEGEAGTFGPGLKMDTSLLPIFLTVRPWPHAKEAGSVVRLSARDFVTSLILILLLWWLNTDFTLLSIYRTLPQADN